LEETTYDVCLSFARDQREFVRDVWRQLEARGIDAFFDESQQVELWGKDLTERLDSVYRKEAQFCVAFVSQDWLRRSWPAHERRSALARMLDEPGYFLPVRFDDSEIPGLSPTIGYLDGRSLSPEELARLIARKLQSRKRFNYLPLIPNRLFAALELEVDDEEGQVKAREQASAFMGALSGLTRDQREAVLLIARFGCGCSMPQGIHLPLHSFLRMTEWNPDRVLTTLRALPGVPGFSIEYLPEGPSEKPDETLGVELRWEPLVQGCPPGPATDVAQAMLREAGYQMCGDCYESALERLDFSRTSSLLDWSNDEFEELGPDASPRPIREVVRRLFNRGWTMEMTGSQIRFLEPESLFYDAVALDDPTDPDQIAEVQRRLIGLSNLGLAADAA
jgi:hypothetical protein